VSCGSGEIQKRMRRISSSGSSKTAKVGLNQISIQPKEPMCEIVLRLVWCAVDPGDCDNGMVARRRFLPRQNASLLRNAEIFSRRRSMFWSVTVIVHDPTSWWGEGGKGVAGAGHVCDALNTCFRTLPAGFARGVAWAVVDQAMSLPLPILRPLRDNWTTGFDWNKGEFV